MRKKLFTTFALATLLAASVNAGDYKVTGSIKGLADGTKLTLVPLSHAEEKPIAETTVSAGIFTFSGNVTEPMCVQIRVPETYGSITLMVDNENATVTATASSRDSGNGIVYTFADVKVEGSPLTDKLRQFTSVKDTLNAVRNDFSMRYEELQKQIGAAYKEKDSVKMAELKATDKYKQMEKEDLAFFKRVETSYNNVITANKDTYWGPLLMINLTSYLTPDQRPQYEQFSAEAKASYYGKKVYEELYPAGTVGQKVPDFTVTDDAGKTHTLASLLKGKKYMVIDFWASWCGPCRREIPNVKNQYALYKDKGLEVVSISIDKNAEAWKKAVKEEQLEWPNFLSPEVAKTYKVKAVPTMYLVDSEGKIIAENDDARGQKLAEKLKELF